MTEKERVLQLVAALEAAYPLAECALEYGEDYQLLIAVRLSAQCTDARVNLVTPGLFAAFPTLESFGAAEPEQVEPYIRSCGLAPTKARDIVAAARMLLADFGGRVPGTMEQLLTLPGVGRKTANLLLGDVFHAPGAVVVDTHCIRLSNRMGLVDTKVPDKIENRLRDLLPPEKSNDFCHRLVLHGRAVCTARRPQCETCPLRDLCPRVGVEP